MKGSGVFGSDTNAQQQLAPAMEARARRAISEFSSTKLGIGNNWNTRSGLVPFFLFIFSSRVRICVHVIAAMEINMLAYQQIEVFICAVIKRSRICYFLSY